MEIRIAIHTTEPLTGTAVAGTEESRYFEGWLELLRALATLIGAGVPGGETTGASMKRSTEERESDGRADESN